MLLRRIGTQLTAEDRIYLSNSTDVILNEQEHSYGKLRLEISIKTKITATINTFIATHFNRPSKLNIFGFTIKHYELTKFRTQSMSYFINEIKNFIGKFFGQSTAEIIFNGIIGCAFGYIVMKYAKTSATLIGISLMVAELVTEGSTSIDAGAVTKYCKMFSEWTFIAEIYRRFAQRGFLGGTLIGMSFA